MARTKTMPVPEVGAEAPEFNLPSAQGGQLRLSMRTVCGPVVVAFFRGTWSEEDVEYFKALSAKEDEINHAGASVVGIGAVEPDEAREFVRASGAKSFVLYDYVRVTSQQWGLLEKDKEHGTYARPAVFIVGADHKVVHAWVDGRPPADEILAKISEITGLPKPPEEAEEKKADGTAEGAEKPKKMSAEERERIKAERRAAREAGKSVKTGEPQQKETPEKAPEDEPGPEKESGAAEPEREEAAAEAPDDAPEQDSEEEAASETEDETQDTGAQAESEPEKKPKERED